MKMVKMTVEETQFLETSKERGIGGRQECISRPLQWEPSILLHHEALRTRDQYP